jgi:hypothetical protein
MAHAPIEGILIAQHTQAKNTVQCFLRPDKANRHGLITGATGTGKTITLQITRAPEMTFLCSRKNKSASPPRWAIRRRSTPAGSATHL